MRLQDAVSSNILIESDEFPLSLIGSTGMTCGNTSPRDSYSFDDVVSQVIAYASGSAGAELPLEIDTSSVFMVVATRNETMPGIYEAQNGSEHLDLEEDVVLRFSPKRAYTLDIEIAEISRGVPRFVDPEHL